MTAFTQKKSNLFSSSNAAFAPSVFVRKGLEKAAETRSGNGAKKFSTTLDPFVDQFAKVGTYRAPRSFADISNDCETLYDADPLMAAKFALYLRTITRKVSLLNGEVTDEPQKGAEMKHEAIMRMIWFQLNNPDVFWGNVGLFVSLGSWHDIFSMLQYDLVYNGWENRKLDWPKMGALILSGLSNESSCNLVKKYLPQLKARSACKTVEAQANCMIAKWICSLVFGSGAVDKNTYKLYRQLKTSGTAHEWQKLISQRKFSQIDFGKIHGRALNLLVKGKFLDNQGLKDKYAAWVGDAKDVKYTGFVHELFGSLPTKDKLEKHIKDTTNKQFATLIEKGGEGFPSSFIVVRDTSGSMGSLATGTKITCFNIAKSLALYFSEFLTGRFANSFIEFNSSAKLHVWKGKTPVDKWYNDSCNFVGSTNFQSVISLFVTLKQNGVEESEFPTGILCISDSEFDPGEIGKTNVESAKSKLKSAGFSQEYVDKFVIVLWNLQSNYYGLSTGQKFETLATDKGTFYFSGYSASVISFLTKGVIETPRDLFNSAMDQQVLNMVKV